MILAIDTSSAIAVAVTDDAGDRALSRRSKFAPRGHAELLSGLIREAMHEAGATRADVGAVVVGTGPAPFTGLRVGLVTARTIAMVWQVPVWGVCSLDAVGAEHGDAVVVSDARRREVYAARYEGGARVQGPDVVSPTEVRAPQGVPVVGRGAVLYPDAFPGAATADPDPLWLVRVALTSRAAGEELLPEPLYLRRPDVHGVPGA